MYELGEESKANAEAWKMGEDELNTQKLCIALYGGEYHRAIIQKPPGEELFRVLNFFFYFFMQDRFA